jgi:glutamate racemase
VHLVITDSGLGGLGICAAIERALRRSGSADTIRLTYVNAWPEEGVGYNALPDQDARLAVFDRALDRMSQLAPDRLLIACNTLSILFPLTRFAGRTTLPVHGIIDAGVDLFCDALSADPTRSIALFGTRITIESGVHRERLVARGVLRSRIASVPCHGLAAEIERHASGRDVTRLIDACASATALAVPPAGTLCAGLCCTHYGYVADRFRAALEHATGRSVEMLDPNGALVTGLMRTLTAAPGKISDQSGQAAATISVGVVSKVRLGADTLAGIGTLVGEVSPATERALLAYQHVPDLF